MVICEKCKTEDPEGNQFCANCGNSFVSAVSANLPTSPPQTQTWSVPEGNQPQEFSWKTVNLIIGGVAGLAILLLTVWFLMTKFSLSSGPVKTWNNITPGITTKSEVVSRLGSPQQEKVEDLGNLLLYDSGTPSFPNVVISDEKSGKVLGELVSVTNETEGKKYYQEMLSLGKPEKIMFSTYQQFSKIFIFSQKGITYSTNEATKTVDAVHFYVPTTLSDYLSRYGKFYSEKDEYKF